MTNLTQILEKIHLGSERSESYRERSGQRQDSGGPGLSVQLGRKMGNGVQRRKMQGDACRQKQPRVRLHDERSEAWED